jgi:large subunit ribosomal protein L13
MKSFMPSKKTLEQERKWFIVDLDGETLGRQAVRIATVLRGKHKPEFTPNLDAGDFVIVINAEKLHLTGRKLELKEYHRHSNYPGGIRTQTAEELRSTDPERMVRLAVKRMLPKGPLGRQMLRKLKVYRGSEHPHQAQTPEPLNI